MITTDDILTTCGEHPDRVEWVSPAVEKNAAITASRVTALLTAFGQSRTLDSGFRDLETNKNTPGAADYSRHMYGMAADIEDADGKLKAFVRNNPRAVQDAGLWCEPLAKTPAWLHVQIVPIPGVTTRVPL